MNHSQTVLIQIRSYLEKNNIDAIYIPKNDRFFGEYIQERDEILKFVSQFSGSFGYCVITKTHAALWVDGRYTIQAGLETDAKEWIIYSIGEDSLQDFLVNNSIKNFAFDPWLISINQFNRWKNCFKDIHFMRLNPHWINDIWQERPIEKTSIIFNHDLQFSGLKTAEKIAMLSNQIQKPYLIFKPENFCWLLNVRGYDVPFSPLVHGALIWKEDDTLDVFVNDEKNILSERKDLKEIITIYPFHSLYEKIAELKTLFVHEDSTPIVFESATNLIASRENIDFIKARKNSVEQNGMRNAHIKDAVAVIKTLYWIDTLKSKENLYELDVSKFLLEKRQEQENFLYPSFETISSSGPNAAIVHYHPTIRSNRSLQNDRIFLLDSGGQYLEGTTDITRTIAIESAISEEKKRYTEVLKGNIALASIRFPKGTTGGQLDVLARQYLWKNGLTYNHGTGHGVGCCLNVHEGPQSISSRSTVPLEIGMILSNEPGFYLQDRFGIRIENLEIVKPSLFENFLEFETLTLVPYDKNLILKDMLTIDEMNWIEQYYTKIKELVVPFLDDNHKNWLDEYMNII
jgi:Xaa-Pro aminopeptidase